MRTQFSKCQNCGFFMYKRKHQAYIVLCFPDLNIALKEVFQLYTHYWQHPALPSRVVPQPLVTAAAMPAGRLTLSLWNHRTFILHVLSHCVDKTRGQALPSTALFPYPLLFFLFISLNHLTWNQISKWESCVNLPASLSKQSYCLLMNEVWAGWGKGSDGEGSSLEQGERL